MASNVEKGIAVISVVQEDMTIVSRRTFWKKAAFGVSSRSFIADHLLYIPVSLILDPQVLLCSLVLFFFFNHENSIVSF